MIIFTKNKEKRTNNVHQKWIDQSMLMVKSKALNAWLKHTKIIKYAANSDSNSHSNCIKKWWYNDFPRIRTPASNMYVAHLFSKHIDRIKKVDKLSWKSPGINHRSLVSVFPYFHFTFYISELSFRGISITYSHLAAAVTSNGFLL